MSVKIVEPDHAYTLKLSSIGSAEEVTKFAIESIRSAGLSLALFCPDRSVQTNRQILALLAPRLRRRGFTVFDPTIFLGQIQKISGADQSFLREVFWAPFMKSGCVKICYFTASWRDLEEETWFHEQAVQSNISIMIAVPKFEQTPVNL